MRTGDAARRRRDGLASFRAVEADVRRALEAGATLVRVYEQFYERLGMSYSQFARYAGPLRNAERATRAGVRSALTAVAGRNAQAARPGPDDRSGPPRGRPEVVVPAIDLDNFAARTLKNNDLI
jgi:hypothetical protein